MAKKAGAFNLIITLLLIIGGLNWGLAIWDINLISVIFKIEWLILTIYTLIGLSALYELYQLVKK